MTLLSIANAVADETKGPRPATIISNTAPEAQNILRIINKVGLHADVEVSVEYSSIRAYIYSTRY